MNVFDSKNCRYIFSIFTIIVEIPCLVELIMRKFNNCGARCDDCYDRDLRKLG